MDKYGAKLKSRRTDQFEDVEYKSDIDILVTTII